MDKKQGSDDIVRRTLEGDDDTEGQKVTRTHAVPEDVPGPDDGWKFPLTDDENGPDGRGREALLPNHRRAPGSTWLVSRSARRMARTSASDGRWLPMPFAAVTSAAAPRTATRAAACRRFIGRLC